MTTTTSFDENQCQNINFGGPPIDGSTAPAARTDRHTDMDEPNWLLPNRSKAPKKIAEAASLENTDISKVCYFTPRATVCDCHILMSIVTTLQGRALAATPQTSIFVATMRSNNVMTVAIDRGA
jgi:hypothetical protein